MLDPTPDLDALKRRWLAAIGVSASTTGTYQEMQQSPVYLPQVFAGNEEGKRAMTKAELETFIDHRWRSRCERLEQEVETLKRRVNELESRGK
jgi:vacuolar-type H+-ATPase subunit D/Vma8